MLSQQYRISYHQDQGVLRPSYLNLERWFYIETGLGYLKADYCNKKGAIEDELGPISIQCIRKHISQFWIYIVKIKQSRNRLFFIMGILILVRWYLLMCWCSTLMHQIWMLELNWMTHNGLKLWTTLITWCDAYDSVGELCNHWYPITVTGNWFSHGVLVVMWCKHGTAQVATMHCFCFFNFP